MNKQEIKNIILECSSPSRTPRTDKGLYHAYEEFYSEILISFLEKSINFLEIGTAEGASLKMWELILPKAKIYGVDADYNRLKYSKEELKNITLLPQGDQTDPNIFKNIPMMDIIVDDASHISTNSIKTFNILKDKLNLNGLYVIEDVWEEQLKEYPKDFLAQFEIIDLRSIKNRGDDIILLHRKTD